MRRDKFTVNVPRERIVTRDYWELLDIAPEDRIEFTNQFFYKDLIVTKETAVKQLKGHSEMRLVGWRTYEIVDFETEDKMVVFRMMKVISYAIEVVPYQNATILENELYSQISDNAGYKSGGQLSSELTKPYDNDDYAIPNCDEIDWKYIPVSEQVDIEDMNFIEVVLRANDKRIRDRVKGIKVYEEFELLGKDRCSVGAFSFITKHCNGAVYRDGVCYGHWMQMQDREPGYNPGLPYESLHTAQRPYIASLDEAGIFARMKAYVEALKDPAPSHLTLKKPRCKHLLHADECSICLNRPSVKSDSIDNLPTDTVDFMVFDY